MMCPNCSGFNDKVIDTRPVVELDRYIVKRRRECLDCGWRWVTIEKNNEIKAFCVDKETIVPQFTAETEICLKIRVEFNALKGLEQAQDELEITGIALEGYPISQNLMAHLFNTHQDELEEVCWDEVYGAEEGETANGTA